ncbi:MAG TPA: ATP-binding protein [Myxococcota bacterium]|nr:ATP-binding protein [Myxococcota bacterium]
MTAALYAITAVFSAALATRAWLRDRDHPARRAFMGLGWSLAFAQVLFALSFLPFWSAPRVLYPTGFCLAPAFALRCVDTLFDRGRGQSLVAERLPWFAGLVGAVMAIAQAVAFPPGPRTSAPELVVGAIALLGAALVLQRLHEARETARLTVERRRIGWLYRLTGATVAFGLAEWVVRQLSPVVDQDMAFFERGLMLQGALPPISALLSAMTVYVLYHTIVADRIVALQDLLSRMTAVAIMAAALVAAHAVTLWFVELARFPLHSSLLLFLVSCLFLSLFAVTREPLRRLSARWFPDAPHELREAVEVLVRELPGHTTSHDVARLLADRLHDTGRFGTVAVYLFDSGLDAYRLSGARGATMTTPLEVVAPSPFVDAFRRGADAYARDALPTLVRRPQEVARLMDATACDLAVPLREGEVVLGWLSLRDEPWSDGFTDRERAQLGEVASMAALVLSNVESFRKLEEEHRLAALGTMAAGLAHEIRNPLTGLKGAAQVLEEEPMTDGARDMLQVIVDEVHRLDHVVTRFLDFARPLVLHRAPDSIHRLVHHTVALARAGAPPGVEIVIDADPDLPRVDLDAARVTQVLLNLVTNALHAVGDEGSVVVRTRRVIGRAGRDEVEVSVTDDGPGLSPEVMSQLFTPFFTTRPGGTGLGLAICKRIVALHGGQLEALAAPERGATFVVRLPLLTA